MIGIVVRETEREAVEEFFQLFKTPWEPAIPSRKYRVVLTTVGQIDTWDADLFLVYGSSPFAVDRQAGLSVRRNRPGAVRWGATMLHVYGPVATFGANAGVLESQAESVDCSYLLGGRLVRRIGYDLLEEIQHLLSRGQPASQSLQPTLEMHVELLRQLLRAAGVSFLEIPPRPHDYSFMCCLTHDVDFFGIRRHRFDRTLVGFVARASLGTALDLARGRRSIAEAVRNWGALLSLPLVFLGLQDDFWNPFEDYKRIEKHRRSTYFLVPFKNRPGVPQNGRVATNRAVKYQASEIGAEARKMAARGSELAVHGLDAWCDENAGRAEMRELLSITKGSTAGVRMHWLYFAADAPQRLEAAGFEYDSTCGYNDAVGYKAGTSQVFRLLGTHDLLELPLSIMDSALFYRNRMGLSDQEAADVCRQIVSNAREYGGTIVINWHDRSVAPERLWGGFYEKLLDQVGADDRAWFATARDAVSWFRWRRSIQFSSDPESGRVTVSSPGSIAAGPAATVLVQRPNQRGDVHFESHPFDGHEAITLELQESAATGVLRND